MQNTKYQHEQIQTKGIKQIITKSNESNKKTNKRIKRALKKSLILQSYLPWQVISEAMVPDRFKPRTVRRAAYLAYMGAALWLSSLGPDPEEL